MDFDFTTYLSKLLSIPPSQITIQFLTGGVVNATVRASFTPPVDLTQFGHSQSVPSVVLKHGPPYMATNPSWPVSPVRQDIEARTLVLLDPKSKSALPVSSLFTKYPKVKIPRFIHHDNEEHVLIMTDLGSSVVKIDDWLTQEPPPNPEDVEHIAKDLGRFLAEFVTITGNEPNAELLPVLSNSVLIDRFNLYALDTLKTILPSQGVPDAEILIKRVANVARDSRKTDLCLGMVDLWCNNIVIDSDMNVCLVDWEYFGLSNASCELSLLVQSLHWILLKPSSTDAAKKCTTAFISTMLRNYGQVCAGVPSPRFRRYALIIHGRVTISLMQWNADQFDDAMKQKALESGLSYLRAAGESEDTMDVSIFDSETVTPYESLYEKAREILAAR